MIISSSKHLILAFNLALFFTSLPVFSQEKIISYDSHIEINQDGSMIVTEVIQVRAEGDQIDRGIYRDFPTYFSNGFGFMRIVGFEVISVKRDNKDEPWQTKGVKNGMRVYIGDENMRLEKGSYTYTLRYKTNNQIGYFKDHDELYWNVTGNGWAFPIDKVSAKVSLPTSVSQREITMEGYSGKLGSKDQDYVATVMDSSAMIQGTKSLNKQEGLTLVMTWPKGVISELSETAKIKSFLLHNSSFLMGIMTLIATFIFLYRTWSKVGKDLKPGVIFPHYNPPKGYSPAASRYISEMGYDKGALTAAVINLAVKGHLIIKKQDDNYILTKKSFEHLLAPGESVLLENLFDVSDELELNTNNRLKINAATTAHEKALEEDYLNIYFSRNSGRLWRSALLVFGMFIITAIVGGHTGSSSIPFFLIPFAIIIILYIIFKVIMKAPSKKGRLLLDKLEGFKKYLEVAEKEELNLRNPPEKTPELFERYLPFAIALGVEQAWSDQFKKVFAELGARTGGGEGYHPIWYAGNFNLSHLDSFTTDVSSSITSAISSASAAPGSSSGSGGGGSSGGGGGGGGGGGW